MKIVMIILGIVLCVISLNLLNFEIKDEKTLRSKFYALIYYVAEPFAGSILLYLGVLLIIAGLII